MSYQSPLRTEVAAKYADEPRIDVVDLIPHAPSNARSGVPLGRRGVP